MVVEHRDFGEIIEVRYERVHGQFAEEFAERDVLRRRHRSVAEEEHLVVHQRAMDRARDGVAHGLREIDAADFCHERRAIGNDFRAIDPISRLCHERAP